MSALVQLGPFAVYGNAITGLSIPLGSTVRWVFNIQDPITRAAIDITPVGTAVVLSWSQLDIRNNPITPPIFSHQATVAGSPVNQCSVLQTSSDTVPGGVPLAIGPYGVDLWLTDASGNRLQVLATSRVVLTAVATLPGGTVVPGPPQQVLGQGPPGASIREGTGVPSGALGSNGDVYIDGATGNGYVKASGSWGSVAFSLRGPTGATGPPGTTLPTQTGNAGKLLSTDGTSPLWTPLRPLKTMTWDDPANWTAVYTQVTASVGNVLVLLPSTYSTYHITAGAYDLSGVKFVAIGHRASLSFDAGVTIDAGAQANLDLFNCLAYCNGPLMTSGSTKDINIRLEDAFFDSFSGAAFEVRTPGSQNGLSITMINSSIGADGGGGAPLIYLALATSRAAIVAQGPGAITNSGAFLGPFPMVTGVAGSSATVNADVFSQDKAALVIGTSVAATVQNSVPLSLPQAATASLPAAVSANRGQVAYDITTGGPKYSDGTAFKPFGTVTSVAAGTGLSGGTITNAGTLSLPNTGPGASTIGGGTTYVNSVTLDAQGRVTAAVTGTPAGTGGSGSGTVTSVATGTGLSGGPVTTTGTIALANTTVAPGSYTNANLTVDAQGRLTAAANGTGGSGGTLASDYAAGTSQASSTVALDATRLGVRIRDNATPITGSLLQVQNSGGTTNYLDVNASGSLALRSGMADGSTAVGLVVDTAVAWSNVFARTQSWRTNGVEKAFVQATGFFAASGGYFEPTLNKGLRLSNTYFEVVGCNLAPDVDLARTCGFTNLRFTQVWARAHAGIHQDVTGTGAVAVNTQLGEMCSLTPTGNITGITLAAGLPAQLFTLNMVGAGGFTWPTTITNARLIGGTFAKTAGATVDSITFRYNATAAKWDQTAPMAAGLS